MGNFLLGPGESPEGKKHVRSIGLQLLQADAVLDKICVHAGECESKMYQFVLPQTFSEASVKVLPASCVLLTRSRGMDF